jgi:predicted RNA-binding protein Jag
MSYDAKAEPNEFVADSRAEAVAKAVRFFGVEEPELRVNEPPEVFGLGARVVVIAVPKAAPKHPGGGDRGQERGGRGGRDRTGGDRGDRPRGRDRGGDRPRGRDRDRARGSDREQSREESPRREAASESADADREEAPRPVTSKGQVEGDISPVGAYVVGMIERMGLGDFKLSEAEEDTFLVVQLEGPAIERLSSDERAVGALQLLANQAAMRTDEDSKRVVLDCDGDAEKRESFLERQVVRAANRAKEAGRAVALDPMNGRDRRALHVAVRPIEGVITMSVGTGRYRQVVIVPEGAPEYEEAAKAAQEAEERDGERTAF